MLETDFMIFFLEQIDRSQAIYWVCLCGPHVLSVLRRNKAGRNGQIFALVLLLFFEMGGLAMEQWLVWNSLCRQGWPCSYSLTSASASWVLRWQMWASIPSLKWRILIYWFTQSHMSQSILNWSLTLSCKSSFLSEQSHLAAWSQVGYPLQLRKGVYETQRS